MLLQRLLVAYGPGLVYLGVALALAPGSLRALRRQPCLVLARRPDRFRQRVDDVGGPVATRHAVAVDLGLLLALNIPAAIVLAQTQRPWLAAAPASAAVFDVIEDTLLVAAVRSATPTQPLLSALNLVAIVKFAGYGATLASLVVGS
jgi:hypothetical protein